MKNIIVPLGSSQNSKNTLQYAINFAKEINATLYILNAYYIPKTAGTIINVDDIVARERKQLLEEMIENVDTKGVDLKIIAAKGDVVDAVIAINDEIGVDLILVGPRPNDLGQELFLGRTSGSIVKQTDIPVLIVPENYAFKPIKKVLTAIKSGVIKNTNALKPLTFIIEKMQARMHLLQVKTPGFLPEDLEFFSDLAAITSSYNSSENATLFQGLLEHLNAKNPDLICVFRRKRGFFKKLWEQNTIKKVNFESRLPLLVLKETE